MSLTVLSVAYPFAPVSADPVGGAEQVLSMLDRALVGRGHRSVVIAAEGSEVAGELVPVPAVAGEIAPVERDRIHAAVRERIGAVLRNRRCDVVHMHGVDFHACLPPPGVPLLVTLHLPLDWYPVEALTPSRAATWLHPVSASQAATAPPGAMLAPPIPNGVRMPAVRARRRGFALALGRICPEKGFDDALDAAARAGMALVLAGATFPYAEHRAFLRARIEPRLDRQRSLVGPVSGHAKQRLLAQARCLVVSSRVAETSSLVAMEALAAGTPVVGYRVGALPEIVEEGLTGLLVEPGDVGALAAAMRDAARIDPELCRRAARERFAAGRMIDAYLARYAELSRPAAA